MTTTEQNQAQDITTLRAHEAQFVIGLHHPERTKDPAASSRILIEAHRLEKLHQNRRPILAAITLRLSELSNQTQA